MRQSVRLACALTAVVSTWPAVAAAQSVLSGEPITIARAKGPITIDGDLSDEGWRDATRVERWYEIQPGDNVDPKVRSVGYLTYDDRFFYAAFEFDDPDPGAIRAPLADRDNMPGYTDYGGIILDTRNDGHSAVELLVNPRNVQFDAVTDDAGGGENATPDFFWDSAARITTKGWTLEIRVPFSSLRYRNVDPQTWGILLYRNYPRDYHYQIFSAKIPRGGNCFICRSNRLLGLEHLPPGGHLVAAPYLFAREAAHPRGNLGSPLVDDPVSSKVGFDLKWTPNPDTAIDATVKPDFSQVESDTAQISTNERFALFYPEKRPFFLEGVELLATPIQAVYTRTITAPRWGARVTGKESGINYTVLIADDSGGGSVVIPGPNASSLAPQDFSSRVFVARVRRDIARSFVSLLVTNRESDGGSHNRVLGPDFQWRPSSTETVTGQWLVSKTVTPDRADLTKEWTGRSLSSHAAQLRWQHNTTHVDAVAFYNDLGDGFRADVGFVPQVGYRETFGQTGWTFHPKGFVSLLRTFLFAVRQIDTGGELISRQVSPGVNMNTRLNGFMLFQYKNDRIRSGAFTFPRQHFDYVVAISPSRRLSQVAVDGSVGQDIDFSNSRTGRGARVNLNVTLHPTDHLELALIQNQQWLYVDDPAGASRRLFTARVSRLRSTYTFTARTFVRLIGQYLATDRDPALYTLSVPPCSGTFSGSALFAYKLNWQSVLFIGYGDDRERTEHNRLERADRQAFVKISYAFQR